MGAGYSRNKVTSTIDFVGLDFLPGACSLHWMWFAIAYKQNHKYITAADSQQRRISHLPEKEFVTIMPSLIEIKILWKEKKK